VPDNKDVVHAIPSYFCPGCGYQFSITRDRWVSKRSKRLLKQDREQVHVEASTRSSDTIRFDEYGLPEPNDNDFVVVTCGNHTCSQYDKVKVIRIPRVVVPSTTLNIED
jgi:hypothetical protein